METPIKLLILEGEPELALTFIYAVKKSAQIGDIHVISRTKTRVQYSRYVKSYHIINSKEDHDLIEFIVQLQNNNKADVLVPIFEDEVAFVARNQVRLRQIIKIIPLPSIEQYQNLSNKAMLSKVLKQRSLPAPETIIYTRETCFIDQLRKLKFPVLFKPSFSWGGRGIIKFNDIEPLLEHIGENQYENHSFIVQSFIEGFDIDCNVLYRHGMLKAKCIQKSFVENNSYHMSPGIQFLNQNEVIELVDGFLSAYKYNGIAHIDLRFDSIEGKFKFIEVNVRFWGTMLGSLISANVNFPLLTVFEAMDIPYEEAEFHEGCYMTFNNYLKYKFNNVLKNKKSQIKLKETSLEQLLADPAPKLYWMYSHLRHMILK